MSNLDEMESETWQSRTDAALSWLRRSTAATGGQGASHSWHPLFGWARAYPETTGYLIETLLVYAGLKRDDGLRTLAQGCAKWLETIQLPSGAFPGLLAGNTRPSVFNTSQILFGLAQGEVWPNHEAAARRAVAWLLSSLQPDGAWRAHAFVPGYVPSYYTRAVWAIHKANDLLQNPVVEASMRRSLHFYAERFLPNGAVRDWGFRAGEPAFTHTMAYTLEGYFESALRLGEQEVMDKTIGSVERFLVARSGAGGRTAGRYDDHWRGDYSFLCIAGNCQLSVLCHRIWHHTGALKFKEAARQLLAEVIGFQRFGPNKNTFGALPGSAPFWGAYLPFRYPNWAAKFFLDAMFHVQNEEKIGDDAQR